MPNYITICYKPCEPAPANGYIVQYRPSGSDEAYRTWPSNFIPTSQELLQGLARAALLVTADADGIQYEGLVSGDCPDGTGVGVPWTTGDNPPPESPSESESVPPTPTPGIGNVELDGCFDSQGTVRLQDIRFNGVSVELSLGFPMDAGNTATATVPAAGTHTLEIDMTGYVLASGRIRATDSVGFGFCHNISGLPTTASFPGFIIQDDVPWSVQIDCEPC